MEKLNRWKRGLAFGLAVLMMAGCMSVPAFAAEVSIEYDKIARGKTGKNMTVSFKVTNHSGHDISNLAVGFDVSGGEIWDEDEEDRTYGYAFPFEVSGSLPDTENPKNAGNLGNDKSKTVSISGRVRNDLNEGYYKVPVVVFERDGENLNWLGSEDLQIWISKSTGGSDDDDDEIKSYDFVLGEGQNTPVGRYPEVCNFSINLRNNSSATVYNIKASIVPDADTAKFPFDINEVSYDRMFEKIEADQSVSLDYSFAVRSDSYTGYYLVPMKIYYSKSSTGDELQTYETSFYVHIFNKDKEDEFGDFNEHDREKARIIIDGFTTEPENIIAGEAFDLVLQLKNASSDIGATNILYSIESEKVSDSVVFSTESGSSSVAMDALRPGEVKELRIRLLSKPGVDQRSYGLTIKAKFDSPEFKNAEESMVIDIPVKQIPRLNTGTFEVMPESITVGEESNVMFPINNTGKVILYNVMVKFEADSVQPVETYVGNIKPGETGNVDCMVVGAAPTMDDGKVKAIITYEDENGEVSSVEKELLLFVSEPVPETDSMDMGNFDEMPMEEPGFFVKYKKILIPVGVIAAAAASVGVIMVLRARKRKQEENEDET